MLRTARRVLQLGAVACVLASLPSPLSDLDRHQVPKELVLHLAAGCAALLALRTVRRIPLALVDLLLLAYIALSAASAVISHNHWLAARALGVTLSGAAIFWTARAIARGGLARPLIVALTAAAVIGAITGLLQAYGADLPLMASTRAPGGTFGNRNFMAHVVAIALPALLLITLETRSRGRAAVGLVGLALGAAALLLSRSRAAWLAAIIPAALFLIAGMRSGALIRDRRFRPRLLAIGAAVAIGLIAALTLPNRLDWRSDSPYLESLVGVANFREGSGRGRLVQYRNTLRMALAHPILGVGAGNWPVAYPLYTTPGDPAFDWGDIMPTNPWPSSDWVAIASERGLPALLIFASLALVMVFVGLRRARSETRPDEAPAGLALSATILALLIAGSFDAVTLLAAPSFIAWGLIGALLPPQRELVAIDLSPSRRLLLGSAVALGMLLLVARSTLQGMAMLVAGSGRSVRWVSWAVRLDPGSYRLHMLLAGTPGARGPCTRVRVHAAAAHALFPHHDAPARLLRSCGVHLTRSD